MWRRRSRVGGQQVFSSASVGIVVGRREYESPDQVLRDADTAMYRAKSAGKSGFVVFDEGMHQEALSRLQLETDFRLAFERAEFRVHYQPIVELQGGRLVGAEALVRWQHPRRGLLAPAEFLPLAEETGLIMDLDAWVLKQACAQLARWRAAHPELAGLSMNVNVDERQMVSPDIVDEVLSLLRKHQLPPACLRLEVTETAFRGGRSGANGNFEGGRRFQLQQAVEPRQVAPVVLPMGAAHEVPDEIGITRGVLECRTQRITRLDR